MLEVDGSQKSGSGTILRQAVAFAAILGEPLHIFNIRCKRPQPGLKPQHLEAVLTAAKLCGATVEGAKIGSRELWFHPQEIIGGEVKAEIRTAGSIPMLLITVLPICAYALNPVHISIIRGGTDVSHSPTINYLKHVFLQVLARMGLETSLRIHKFGYFPKGMGRVTIDIQPNRELLPIRSEKFEPLSPIKGISVCTFLADRKVAERQAEAASALLKEEHYRSDIKIVNDFSNRVQKGSSLTLWTRSNGDGMLGGDAIGEIRKPSEAVGREAARNLLKELDAEATVDQHLADLLVPYMALAHHESIFLTRDITDHLETNIWLAEEILDVKFGIKRVNKLQSVTKIAS